MDEKTENFLAHYGVKGMRWGKHRPANMDDINNMLEDAAYDAETGVGVAKILADPQAYSPNPSSNNAMGKNDSGYKVAQFLGNLFHDKKTPIQRNVELYVRSRDVIKKVHGFLRSLFSSTTRETIRGVNGEVVNR